MGDETPPGELNKACSLSLKLGMDILIMVVAM